MMKGEFEKLIGATVSEERWNVIHQVYQFYPTIKDVGGKGQVAKLWADHGFIIFLDMLTRAERLAELDHKRQMLLREIELVDRSIHEAQYT